MGEDPAERASREALRRRDDQLSLLARVSQMLILGDPEGGDLLESLFQEVAATIGAEVYVNYHPPDEAGMRLCRRGGLADDERTVLEAMRYGELLCGRVAERRERLVVADISHADAEGGDLVLAGGYGAGAGFPLLAGDRLLGTVAFLTRSRNHFSDGEVQTVQAVCDQVSAVLDRARVQRELAAGEQRYRALVEAASAVTWSCSATGLIETEQPSWTAFTGQTADEMLGSGWTRALHPQDAGTVVERWRQAVAHGMPFTSEHRIRRRDGAWRWMNVHAVPVRDVDGQILHYQGMNLDVTDRRRTEELLRASHDSFRHLVEHSPFGVYAVDADFRLVQVSDGAQQVFAQVRPLLGRDLADVLRTIWPEPFASEAIARFRHTLATGEPYHAPGTTERRLDIDQVEAYDWKIERVTLPDGRPGAVCHFYDLSERQRYEAVLQERQQQLNLALTAASAGSWSVVPDTGEFVASDRALALHGLEPGTRLTQRAALAGVHPDDVGRVGRAIRDALTTGEPLRLEYRVRHRDGSVHWVAAHADLFRRDGRVRLVGLVQDITDRKRAETALRARQQHEQRTSLALQRALLPAALPIHPSVQVAAHYRAGTQGLEVGGDWYDAIALPDGRLALTVGDVVGHGLDAAAAMGQLRTTIGALADRLAPAQLLMALNRFLARSPVTRFATVCFAVYDPATRILQYASAGHPPILTVTPDGSVARLQDAQSPPLIEGADWSRRQASAVLDPGTLLLLYSDGLIERRGVDLDESLARLEAVAGSLATASVEDVCATVVAHSHPEASDDDIVVLAARVAGRS